MLGLSGEPMAVTEDGLEVPIRLEDVPPFSEAEDQELLLLLGYLADCPGEALNLISGLSDALVQAYTVKVKLFTTAAEEMVVAFEPTIGLRDACAAVAARKRDLGIFEGTHGNSLVIGFRMTEQTLRYLPLQIERITARAMGWVDARH